MMKTLIAICIIFLTSNANAQMLRVFREGKLFGYKNYKDSIVISPVYQYATKFRYNRAVVMVEGKLGAIDSANKVIMPFEYEYLSPLDENDFEFGYRAVYVGEYTKGVINSNGKVKVAPAYRHVSKTNGCFEVVTSIDSILQSTAAGDIKTSKMSYGLLDSNGTVLIPCEFRYISWLNDSLLTADRASGINSHALYNKKGKRLTGFDYMVIGKFYDGLAKVRTDDRYGFILPSGKVAIPVQLEYCEAFQDGIAMISRNEKWGAMDTTGKVVIEPVYEYKEVATKLKRANSPIRF